jgi:hypothetical protein
MTQDDDDLRTVFDYVRRHEWSSARQVGLVVLGGKQRANHFLYRYKDVLFVKRGLTPPQWKIASSDALERLNGRATGAKSPSVAPKARSKPMEWVRRAVPARPTQELKPFDTCGSCGRPIQPSGNCGCS